MLVGWNPSDHPSIVGTHGGWGLISDVAGTAADSHIIHGAAENITVD